MMRSHLSTLGLFKASGELQPKLDIQAELLELEWVKGGEQSQPHTHLPPSHLSPTHHCGDLAWAKSTLEFV